MFILMGDGFMMNMDFVSKIEVKLYSEKADDISGGVFAEINGSESVLYKCSGSFFIWPRLVL